MIADLDETIRNLLKEELPVKNGEIDIKFDQPKREWSSRLSKPTVNLFLYDLRENPALRQHQWERLDSGNGRDGLAHLKRTPMRVDCFYMLTTWAADPADEHRLLSRVVMTLYRFPLLPEDRLEGSLKKPPFDILTRLAHHDRLTNPAEVWSSLDNEMRPSVSYIITLALDPWSEVTGPIVQTLSLRSGQSEQLPRFRKLKSDEHRVDMTFIGGVVRDKSQKEKPAPGVSVAVKGTGLFTTTDNRGRFTLGSLPPGEYTLVAWPEDGKPKERTVTLPGKGGDYDLTI